MQSVVYRLVIRPAQLDYPIIQLWDDLFMPNARQEQSDREALMRSLAGRLVFAVQKVGDCFTLFRTVDVVPPVCAERLTLNQAEELLQTWKLRGRG